tara:strand:+ start:354 stop:554 length:201 start_codon:yes stop_codon:yes gene_type:complete
MIDCYHSTFDKACGTCWFKRGMGEQDKDKRINCFRWALALFETSVNKKRVENTIKENENEKHNRAN